MSEHDFDGDDDIFSKSGRFGGNAEKRKDPAKPGGCLLYTSDAADE